MARKEKDGSKGLGVVLVILIVLLLCALLFLFKVYEIDLPFFKEPQSKFERFLEENNYQGAYTIYINSKNPENEKKQLKNHLDEFFELCQSEEYSETTWTEYRGLEIFNDDIQKSVLERMDNVVYRYYNNEISEDDAKKYLSRLSDFSFTDDKYEECKEYLKLKDFSEKAYLEGVNLYNLGKFEESVKSFKDVNEKDTLRYPLAKDAIETIKKVWGEQQIQEAEGFLEVYNKEGAREILEKAIEVFGTFEEAENMLLKLEPELET